MIDYLFIQGDYKLQLNTLKQNLVPKESDGGAAIPISLVICDPPFGCNKGEWDKKEDKWGSKEFEEAFIFVEDVNSVSFEFSLHSFLSNIYLEVCWPLLQMTKGQKWPVVLFHVHDLQQLDLLSAAKKHNWEYRTHCWTKGTVHTDGARFRSNLELWFVFFKGTEAGAVINYDQKHPTRYAKEKQIVTKKIY